MLLLQGRYLEMSPSQMDSGTCLFRGCSVAGDGCIEAGQALVFTQLTSVLFKKDGVIVNIQMLGSARGLFFFHLRGC